MIRAVRRFFRSLCGWCARGHQSSDRRPRPNKRRKRKFYGAPFVIGRRRSPPSPSLATSSARGVLYKRTIERARHNRANLA